MKHDRSAWWTVGKGPPRRVGLLGVALILGGLAGAQHAAAAEVTPIAELERSSPLTAWEDTVVWSAYDADIDAYRLTALHDGAVVTLNAEPLARPFDADVGPDSRGHAAVVYSRCADFERHDRELGDCDLFIYSLRDGEERPIRNANSGASEYEPTLWRGDVAWARTYDGKADRPFVYRRPLIASRSRSSERLPGVPTRNCERDLLGEGCGTFERRVADLDLYGRWLAVTADYSVEGGLEIGPLRDLRLTDLRHRRTSSIAMAAAYDDGFSSDLTGASLAGGHLVWHGSGSSGGKYGPSTSSDWTPRLRLSTNRRQEMRTGGPRPRLGGFAATPTSLFRVRVPGRSYQDSQAVYEGIVLERLDEVQWVRP